MGAIEVNLSCPNPADPSGRHFADDAAQAAAVVQTVRSHARSDVPVLAKLAADVPDVVELAGACVAARADGLTMVNTLRGMSVDTRTLRPAVAGGMGGLSGPAIRPWRWGASTGSTRSFPRCRSSGRAGCVPGPTSWSSWLRGRAPWRWGR